MGNATAAVEFDDSFVNVQGDILMGEGEGWFGATGAVTHNVMPMKEFGVPLNTEFSGKGKLIDDEVQVAAGLECDDIIDYSGLVDLSFTHVDGTVDATARYNHMLNYEEANCNAKLEIDYNDAYNPVITFDDSYVMGEEEKSMSVVLEAN